MLPVLITATYVELSRCNPSFSIQRLAWDDGVVKSPIYYQQYINLFNYLKNMRKIRLFNMWYDIKSSFWFIPLLMIFSSFIFSLFTLFIDQVLYKEELFQSYEYTQNILKYFVFVGADGARSVLTTVSGSMITVAGVSFSISIVSLSLAASEFGSWLFVYFMHD